MRKKDKLRRCFGLASAIWMMISLGCATGKIGSGVPLHCTTKDEWANYAVVADQKVYLFHVDQATGLVTRFVELRDRVDYLESYCVGVNAYRGEDVSD